MKKTPEQRDADFVRRLASGFDGEIVVTVHTWRRKLSSDGRDLHDIANIVEGGGKLTEAEMRKLYDAGYEAGLQEGESRHPVTSCSVEIFDLYDMAAVGVETLRSTAAPTSRLRRGNGRVDA